MDTIRIVEKISHGLKLECGGNNITYHINLTREPEGDIWNIWKYDYMKRPYNWVEQFYCNGQKSVTDKCNSDRLDFPKVRSVAHTMCNVVNLLDCERNRIVKEWYEPMWKERIDEIDECIQAHNSIL